MNGGCAIASFVFRRLTIPKLDISWFNSKIIPILPPFFPVNPVNWSLLPNKISPYKNHKLEPLRNHSQNRYLTTGWASAPSSGTHLVLLHPSSSGLQGWSRWSPWNRVPELLELLEADWFLLKKLNPNGPKIFSIAQKLGAKYIFFVELDENPTSPSFWGVTIWKTHYM